MGKKYIIELEDEPFCQEDGNFVYKVKGFNNIVFSMMDFGGLGTLTPYTEPDLEQIKKEAYEQGQKDLRESCVPQDEEAYGIGYNEGFQCGLDVTWDAARKIENLPEVEKFEIFGEYDMFHIMRRYTATEAIKKIRQYEQSQKEKPIRAEDVMRQYLDEFCKRRWCCAECILRTDDFTCGRGYSFTGITPVSDEEVRRAYAEVMKK